MFNDYTVAHIAQNARIVTYWQDLYRNSMVTVSLEEYCNQLEDWIPLHSTYIRVEDVTHEIINLEIQYRDVVRD